MDVLARVSYLTFYILTIMVTLVCNLY